MNDSTDELERLRNDWQESATQPPVSVAGLRKRLARRWLLLVVEGVAMVGVGVLLLVTALNNQGLMNWVYWGFFAAYFVVFGVLGVRERLKTLHRSDDSATAILDHAWRDARVRRSSGATLLWVCPVVWAFVTIWMATDGWLGDLGLDALVHQYGRPFAFVTVFCLLTACFGAWMREKGRRQLSELERLADELDDAPA